MKKGKKKCLVVRRAAAGALTAVIILGGAAGLFYVSEIMAVGTRSGQALMAFAADGERLTYSFFGREGEIVWQEAGKQIWRQLAAPTPGERLFLGGLHELKKLWLGEALPFLQERFAPSAGDFKESGAFSCISDIFPV